MHLVCWLCVSIDGGIPDVFEKLWAIIMHYRVNLHIYLSSARIACVALSY